MSSTYVAFFPSFSSQFGQEAKRRQWWTRCAQVWERAVDWACTEMWRQGDVVRCGHFPQRAGQQPRPRLVPAWLGARQPGYRAGAQHGQRRASHVSLVLCCRCTACTLSQSPCPSSSVAWTLCSRWIPIQTKTQKMRVGPPAKCAHQAAHSADTSAVRWLSACVATAPPPPPPPARLHAD